jgi:hypothetical protein
MIPGVVAHFPLYYTQTLEKERQFGKEEAMSINSKIEWTDASWNSARGCTKISPGCKHCYACTFAERFRGVAGHAFEQGFDLRLVPEKLEEPLRWKNPRKIFVNSMSDLFLKDIDDDYIVRVAEVMMEANWHTYQVLTKRSERMRDLLNSKLSFAAQAPHSGGGYLSRTRSTASLASPTCNLPMWLYGLYRRNLFSKTSAPST